MVRNSARPSAEEACRLLAFETQSGVHLESQNAALAVGCRALQQRCKDVAVSVWEYSI